MRTAYRLARQHEKPAWWLQSGERWVFLLAVVTLAIAWMLVVLFDVVGLGVSIGITKEAMVWFMLFDARGPIEWLQWIYMVAFVALGGYLVGRLSMLEVTEFQDSIRRFCLLMTVGVGFMLLEDAGDIRYTLKDLIGRVRGTDDALLGLPQAFAIDAPYLTALALIPLYALIRHGRSVWTLRPARPYLLAGFGLYGLLGIGHLFARLTEGGEEWGGPYPYLGRLLSQGVFRDALERPTHWTESVMHYYLIDFLIEESLELIGIAALVGLLIVVGRGVCARRPGAETPGEIILEPRRAGLKRGSPP